jgi:hypothetical protein
VSSLRRGKWRAVAALVLAVGASIGGLVTPASASTANQWRIANVWGSANGQFESIAATGPGSAWAVGTLSHGVGPVAAHWNGRAWQSVTIPGTKDYSLRQVVASSASNVWVFGEDFDLGTASAFRYDGAHWHTVSLPAASVSSPGLGTGQALVFGPKDVWLALWGACGTTAGKTKCSSDVWHWNGSTWTAHNIGAAITGFTGISDHDLRAVALTSKHVVTAYQWNGSRWSGMSIPHVSGMIFAEWAPSIAMDSNTDIWIAFYKTTCCSVTALHFAKNGWRQFSPSGAINTQLILDGRGGAWVGSLTHWTGSGWFMLQDNLYQVNDNVWQIGQTVKVPGTSGSYWTAGYVIPNRTHTTRPMVALFGPTP